MGSTPSHAAVQQENNNSKKSNFRPQSVICFVKTKSQSVKGAIYKCKFPEEGTWRTLFITSYQLLNITDWNNKFDDTTIENVDMPPDWVKWFWTSPPDQLNVAVIELSRTALKVLSQTKYTRLKSASATPKQNDKVYFYDTEITSANIINVTDQIIDIKIEKETINLGSPLLNEAFEVIGIYTGSQSNSHKIAVNIQYVFNEYRKFVQEQMHSRTENELWIEKLNAIPDRDFQQIGSGGYGKVYKIYEKESSTEFSVKIVGGKGKLTDRKDQVKALENEYRIITELDNHPRIIQYFALIKGDEKEQLMIIMEYLEGGSLEGKLKDQKPLDSNLARNYFVQILEGIQFLHNQPIHHSDIKPANILFTRYDNLKICDFGIASESSVTATQMMGDFHYMSPERLNGGHRSAANDIWSIGATFVQMISGRRLNYEDNVTQFINHIANGQLYICQRPLNEFLRTLTAPDFKKILKQTLCILKKRANCEQLLSIARSFAPRRISKQTFCRVGEESPWITGMSYNSIRDELFLADRHSKMVRAIRLRQTDSGLHDVYSGRAHNASPNVWSVINDSHTLLVCSRQAGPNLKCDYWLVALSREKNGEGSEWRETSRLDSDNNGVCVLRQIICCPLSNLRALVGEEHSTSLELLRLESSELIVHVAHVDVSRMYNTFSATNSRDTLVATSHEDESVRVHRLRDSRLEELSCILSERPYHLLWIENRLLVDEWRYNPKMYGYTSAVTEFEWSGTGLKLRRELIAHKEGINLLCWCAVDNGLALFDMNSREILYYVLV